MRYKRQGGGGREGGRGQHVFHILAHILQQMLMPLGRVHPLPAIANITEYHSPCLEVAYEPIPPWEGRPTLVLMKLLSLSAMTA